VQVSDISSPVSDPANTNAYPIVATTNVLLYSCYGVPAELAAVRNFFNWYFTDDIVNNRSTGILARAGFSPSNINYLNAIVTTFFQPDAATAPLKLRIERAGSAGSIIEGVQQNQCQAIAPGA
jgi:hypothetical protein